jgi:hypothetical protein
MNTDLAAQQALDRLAKVGPAKLTKVEKTLATCWLFDAGVSNSGFARYYTGKNGDLAYYVPTALKTTGARQLLPIAVEANALFGPEGPSPDREIRRRQLADLPDFARGAFTQLEARYAAAEQDIDDCLEVYLDRIGRQKTPVANQTSP